MIPTPPRAPTTVELRQVTQAATFTTPQPVYEPAPPPVRLTDQTGRMDHHEKMQLRTAAFRATRLYPGAVGKLISREILAFEEMGLRLANDGVIMQAVHDILTGR